MSKRMNTDWQQLHGEHFDGLKVLITGGAGFIGSNLSEALIRLGASVVVLDDLSGGDTANLEAFSDIWDGRLEFVEGSILDQALLSEHIAGCRYIFHQAALASVPRSVAQPREFNRVNVDGTLNVLQAAAEAGVGRVMFAASSSAYGDSETLPKIETMPPLPKSPYAANKLAGEHMMRAWAASYGLDTAALRYFNIFGCRQNANSAYAAVIAAFAKALFQDEHPLIYGDGEQSRDFTFVDNAVHANLLAARCQDPIGGRVINVACGERVTVNQLAEMMAKLSGKPHLTPKHEPERTGDVKHSLADLQVAKSVLGYEPIVSFEQGLETTVRWYESALRQEQLAGAAQSE